MEVRAKKNLGQHFLTDQAVADNIVRALTVPEGRRLQVLEVGPGTGVLTGRLLAREDVDLKAVEIDRESVDYLLLHYPGISPRLVAGDFLRLPEGVFFPEGEFAVIGNFPYNISSQIFFRILSLRERIPQVVCMVQKEVAERIAEPPGSRTYGILSVLLQAWYDIEYLFSVGEGAFLPPPKVKSAVIRLRRNGRTSLGCDEALFVRIVKTAFGQRRKMLRNSLAPLLDAAADRSQTGPLGELLIRRPETLSVEDFIGLTRLLSGQGDAPTENTGSPA